MIKHLLTPREKTVFEYLVLGYSTAEISLFLGISSKTVRNHISNVVQKLGVNGRVSAVLELIKMNEIKF